MGFRDGGLEVHFRVKKHMESHMATGIREGVNEEGI